MLKNHIIGLTVLFIIIFLSFELVRTIIKAKKKQKTEKKNYLVPINNKPVMNYREHYPDKTDHRKYPHQEKHSRPARKPERSIYPDPDHLISNSYRNPAVKEVQIDKQEEIEVTNDGKTVIARRIIRAIIRKH